MLKYLPRSQMLIDPTLIEYIQFPEFWILEGKASLGVTKIREGNWDNYLERKIFFSARYESFDSLETHMVRLLDYSFFRALKARFVEGQSWESTEFFGWLKLQNNVSRYDSEDKIKARLSWLDNTFANFDPIKASEGDLPFVNIGRGGRVSVEDGRHRLLMAKIYECDRILVNIANIHPDYLNEESSKLGLAPRGKITSDMAPKLTTNEANETMENFPEIGDKDGGRSFLDFSSRHLSIDHRDQLIVSTLIKYNCRWVLDVGSNVGVTSNRISDAGMYVIGVESQAEELRIARSKSSRRSGFIAGVADSEFFRTLPSFDAILFLSVLHRIYAASGGDKMRDVFFAAAEKANLLFIEGSTRHQRYTDLGHSPPPFRDLDLDDAVDWHLSMITALYPRWTLVEKCSYPCSVMEPFRFLIVIRRNG